MILINQYPDAVAPLIKTELSTLIIQVDISGGVCRLSSVVSYHECYPTSLREIQQSYLHIYFAALDFAGTGKKVYGEIEFCFRAVFGTTSSLKEFQIVLFP